MINLAQALRIALRALRINKMRSFLTMLGIIIGIAAVIAMMAVGSGASYVISQQIASMGSNILLVIPGSVTSGGIRTGSGGVQTLTYDDARAIQTECPAVEMAAPTVRGSGQVVYGNQNWSTLLMGTTPEMFLIREWPWLPAAASPRPMSTALPRSACWASRWPIPCLAARTRWAR